jgi:hypothetical protein
MLIVSLAIELLQQLAHPPHGAGLDGPPPLFGPRQDRFYGFGAT